MSSSAPSESKLTTIGPWVLCGLLAAAFAFSGGAKVFGGLAAEGAGHFGYSEGFMRFIGVCELAGAIGLLVPRLATWAAAGLLVIMGGAVYSHVTTDPISQAAPAAVLLLLLLGVVRLRRGRALFLAPA